MEIKFKSNPYNSSNINITKSDVLNILKKLDIQDYNIKDLSLFQQSFIHNSYCNNPIYEEYDKPNNCLSLFNKSYETLESIISQYLYNRFTKYHNQNEGFLTKLKIRFVCGEQLAYLSKKLNFGKFIVISKHTEDNCDGRESQNILEDVFEAFLGALFLDSNDNKLIEKFIINCIETYIDIIDLILNDNNYKDQLLRYFQHNYLVHPKYKTIKDEDKNLFVSNINRYDDNNNCINVSKGFGKTKKKSEQDAAKNALILYSVISK